MDSPNNPISDNRTQESKIMLDELLNLPYEQIIQKYNKDNFFNNVFESGVDYDVALLRDLMADDFLPENNPQRLTPEQNDAIIKILAEDQSQNQEEALKKISQVVPNAILPPDFDWNDYHSRAVRIYNALLSLKAVLAEREAFTYKNDVTLFLKLSVEQLNSYPNEIKTISEKLAVEYQKLIQKNILPAADILDEAINFIAKCGRTPIFISALKERKNLGEITTIIIKIDRAIKIALDIKSKKIIINSDQELLGAIANNLVENIHL